MTKLNMSTNDLCAAGTKALAEALRGNSIMKELSLAGNKMGLDKAWRGTTNMSGVMAISNAIPTMGALYSLDISDNRVPDGQAQEIDKLIRRNRLRPITQDSEKSFSELVVALGWVSSLDLSSRFLDHEDASVVAEYVKNNRSGALVKLVMKDNAMLTKEAGKALADMLAANSILKELDISDQAGYRHDDGPGFAKELAAGVTANSAVTSLKISGNNISALVLPQGWVEDSDADSSDDEAEPFIHEDGRRQKAHPGKPEGVIALADAIKNNGVLVSLIMSANALLSKEAGKALAGMLAANSVLTELDVSDNGYDSDEDDGPGFAQELAVGLGANGALETITFGDKQAAMMKTDMTKVDLSGKELGASGAIIAAAFLPKCR